MQLLESTLASAGLPTTRAPVRLSDLPSVTAAFATNSLGIAAVGRIDGTTFPLDRGLMKTITEIYKSVSWDQI
jgi:branched-subunit amino acid aminotransferase/4-amino-4-deoxychorismate lyase